MQIKGKEKIISCCALEYTVRVYIGTEFNCYCNQTIDNIYLYISVFYVVYIGEGIFESWLKYAERTLLGENRKIGQNN